MDAGEDHDKFAGQVDPSINLLGHSEEIEQPGGALISNLTLRSPRHQLQNEPMEGDTSGFKDITAQVMRSKRKGSKTRY